MNIAIATLLLGLPALAGAQATVEAAAGAGPAVTTAAPAQKVGKGIAGALDKLNRTLQQSDKGKSGPTAVPAAVPAMRDRNTSGLTDKVGESNSQKANETQYEPPVGIRQGMEVTELMARFGPPALKITAGPDETYCYVAKDGTSVDATVRANKVAAVQTKEASHSGSTAAGPVK